MPETERAMKNLILGLVFISSFVVVQAQAPTTVDKPAEAPKVEPTPVKAWSDGFKVGGMVRFRPEFKNNYDYDRTTSDAVEFVGQKIQLSVEKEFSPDVKAKITIQDSRLWGGEPGYQTGLSTANDNTRQSTDIREAYIDVKSLLGPIDLVIGRQILAYGDQRLVGHLDWTNVGRSFDGAKLRYETTWLSSHLWGMVISEEDSDIAGNNTNVGRKNPSGLKYDCDPFNKNTCTVTATKTNELDDAYFTGFYNTFKPSEHVFIDLYYLGLYKKWVPVDKYNTLGISQLAPVYPGATTQPFPTTQDRFRQRDNLHTVGIRLTNRTQKEGKAAVIPLDWTVEYAHQSGTTGAYINPQWDTLNTTVNYLDPITQKTVAKNIYREKQIYDSFAFALDVGYTLEKMIPSVDKLRIGLEYDVASGDPNRKDGSVGTFNNLFHTNHIYYGEADQVSWVNMIGKSINILADLGDIGKFRLAYWKVDKHKLQDGWYDVTGALKANASTEAESNTRFGNVYSTTATGRGSDRYAGTLYRNLFREIDFTYYFKFKGLDWGFGYSRIFAGDAVRNRRNDYTVNPLVRKDVFDPGASFAYLMTTYKF